MYIYLNIYVCGPVHIHCHSPELGCVAGQTELERGGGTERRKALGRKGERARVFFSGVFLAKFFGAMGVLEPQGLRRSCGIPPVCLNQVFSIEGPPSIGAGYCDVPPRRFETSGADPPAVATQKKLIQMWPKNGNFEENL